MKEKIFIIEDDLTIQTQLKTLLSGNGYEVDAATDFSRIIEQLKAFAPHLVLLDIKLPGNSGCWAGTLLLQSRITQQYCWRKLLPCLNERIRCCRVSKWHMEVQCYAWNPAVLTMMGRVWS